MLKNIWPPKEIKTSAKIRIFNSNVKSVLLYGSATWRNAEVTHHKTQTFINNYLRRILNTKWPKKISNEKL
jgi:hypothetical protein